MRGRTATGLVVAVSASLTFGASGPFVKPLLDAGWTPGSAVMVRAALGAVLLAPVAAVLLRGRWSTLWTARWSVLLMGVFGVAGAQLGYFAAVQRMDVGTAILIEYLAPVVLVFYTWARTRRAPRPVVIAGTVVAIAGLVLVVGVGASTAPDALGLLFAAAALAGCAVYYVVAAQPTGGLPPVALAASGLTVGAIVLGVAGGVGVLPMGFSTDAVVLFGTAVPFWVPLGIVVIVATAVAYALSITAAGMLGSRLGSFLGLLEVVAAALYAWLLLGEALSPLQLFGGLLILGGIALVYADRDPAALSDADAIETGAIAIVAAAPVAEPPIAEPPRTAPVTVAG